MRPRQLVQNGRSFSLPLSAVISKERYSPDSHMKESRGTTMLSPKALPDCPAEIGCNGGQPPRSALRGSHGAMPHTDIHLLGTSASNPSSLSLAELESPDEKSCDRTPAARAHPVLLQHDPYDSRRTAHAEVRTVGTVPPEVPIATGREGLFLVRDDAQPEARAPGGAGLD